MRIGLPWAAAGAAGAARNSRIPSRLIPDIWVARMLLMAMPSQVAGRYALGSRQKVFLGISTKAKSGQAPVSSTAGAGAGFQRDQGPDQGCAAHPYVSTSARERMQGLPESQVRMPTPRRAM